MCLIICWHFTIHSKANINYLPDIFKISFLDIGLTTMNKTKGNKSCQKTPSNFGSFWQSSFREEDF
jgi:hypothetical protein